MQHFYILDGQYGVNVINYTHNWVVLSTKMHHNKFHHHLFSIQSITLLGTQKQAAK